MIGRWWAEAGKYNVMPIDGSALERMNVARPTIARPRDRFIYYPNGSGVPFGAAPKLYNRPWTITADVVIPEGGAEGVIIAQGGNTGGYTFFVKDQRLHFLYNYLARDKFWLRSRRRFPRARSSCATSSSRPESPISPKAKGFRPAARSISTASWSAISTCPTQFQTCLVRGADLRLRRRRTRGT